MDNELDGLLETQICACLRELVPTLRADYAEVLQRVDLDGARVSEVAQALGTSQNNVSVRLHRARHALKRQQ